MDVLTSELLAAWPGMSVGASANGRSVWVFDGDAIRPKGLTGWTGTSDRGGWPLERGPEEVHVRVRTRAQGDVKIHLRGADRASRERVEEKLLTMRIGDSVPRMDPLIILTSILGARRAIFRVYPAHFRVTLPPDPRGRYLDFFEVGRAPVRLEEESSDGSGVTEISLVP